MARKGHIRLEQIRVASPCPTSWDQMLGDDQIRFCNICAKNVYNLSAMTRADAERLVNQTNKKICGLIYTRRDGTVMTADCPVGLRAIRKRMIKRIASVAAMLAALIGGSRFAIQQYNRPAELPDPIIQNDPEIDRYARDEREIHKYTVGIIVLTDPQESRKSDQKTTK